MSNISLKMTLQEDASTKLSKVASSAQKATNELNKTGQAVDKAFKSNTPKQFASDVGNAMNSAVSDAEELGNALDEAFTGMDASGVAAAVGNISAGFNEVTNGAEKTGKSIDNVRNSTENLGKSIDDIGNGEELGGLTDNVNQTGEAMDQAESKAINLSGALKKLFAVVSAAAIMGQVSAFASDAVDLGKSYTSMMSEVSAISGATGSEIAQMEQTAREYGSTTIFSASEAAEALKYMSLAGWDASQSSQALGGVLDLAAASGMGLGQASDMVTDYLSAFGMEASQASYMADLLSYAQSNSNTTVEQLGEAYRNSAANMHAAGQDVETTTSLLEAMANQGYKGSEAGTALAATMRDITQKMDNGAIKIGDTSIAVQDAQGNFRDLTDILTDVESATAGMGDAEKAAALGTTFTSDSIKAMNMILTEGMDKVSGYEEALRQAGGTASNMSDIMNDNLTGDMANMNSAFEEMQLQVFESMEAPMRQGVQYLTGEVIPALTEWVPEAFSAAANGAEKLGNALKPLFETVLKNPKGVATVFTSIGAGLAVFKGASLANDMLSTANGASKLTTTLANLGNALIENKWAIGAAALAAGVVLVKDAVDRYNEIRIDENLSEHFGSISLDDMQVDSVASQIVPVEITAKLDLANVQFDEAAQLIEKGEAALAENNYLLWKVSSVGLELTEGEQESLIANGQDFVDSITSAFQKNEFGAEETVKALLGDQSTAVIETMQGWFNEDNEELESLGDAFTSLLETAFSSGISDIDMETLSPQIQGIISDAITAEDTDTVSLSETIAEKLQSSLGDGADLVDKEALAGNINEILAGAMTGENVDVEALSNSITELFQSSIDTGISAIDTATALNILQTKMMQMVNGVKQAELQGQLDWLSITSAGAALDSDSWAAVVAKIGEYQTSLMEADETAYQSLLGVVEKAVDNDPSRRGEADAIIGMLEMAYNDLGRSSLLSGWDWMYSSLSKSYDSELATSSENIGSSVNEWMDYFNQNMEYAVGNKGSVDPTSILSGVMNNSMNIDSGLSSDTKGALLDRYQTMMPTIEDMQSMIDTANENGEAVSEAVLQAYNQAMEIGAAAGDQNATYAVMANALKEQFGSFDNFSSMLEEAGLTVDNLEPEFQEAIDRAFTETVADTDYSALTEGLAQALSGEEIDWENVQKILNEFGFEIDLSEVPVTATGEPDIDEIARSLEGLTATGNTKEIPGGKIALEYEVETADTLSGIAEKAGISLEELQAANQQIFDERGTWDLIYKGDLIYIPEANTSGTADATGEAVNETTQAAQEAADASDNDITVTGEVNGEYTAGEASGVEEAGAELSGKAKEVAESTEPPTVDLDASGSLYVTLTEENNIPEVYAEVGNAVSAAFGKSYSADARISVTLHADYSLANPSKVITFGGGATGSAVITASLHAEGGYFDEPHLGMVAEAGVGEYIIPMDGSDRSLEMWQDAGRMLGIDTGMKGAIAPAVTSQDAMAPAVSVSGSGGEKTINLNINGNGKIQASGMSKEEVLQILMDNVKDVLIDMLQDDILTEGDGTYDY